MLKFENLFKINGSKFHKGRFEIYRVEDSLTKTYFHIGDSQTQFPQTIELKKEATPVYTLYNTFNRTMLYLDLDTIKDMSLFLKKIETLIDTSVN